MICLRIVEKLDLRITSVNRNTVAVYIPFFVIVTIFQNRQRLSFEIGCTAIRKQINCPISTPRRNTINLGIRCYRIDRLPLFGGFQIVLQLITVRWRNCGIGQPYQLAGCPLVANRIFVAVTVIPCHFIGHGTVFFIINKVCLIICTQIFIIPNIKFRTVQKHSLSMTDQPQRLMIISRFCQNHLHHFF